MAIVENLHFVQFLHPGGEPTPKSGAGWNRGKHTRKYLVVDGRYLNSHCRPVAGPVEFWGEWEAESEPVKVFGNQGWGGPQRIWRPYYEKKVSYAGLQNTDPFVFGGFYYTGCQQRTKSGPTQLRYLQRGSVVLFGSRVGGQFAVDTVFVVKDWVDHDAASYRHRLHGLVPDAYWDVTLYPRYSKEGCGDLADGRFGKAPDFCVIPETSWRLYIGATYDEPFEGMFSFFPCQPSGATDTGFSRPAIYIPNIINPDLARKYRLNPPTSIDDVKARWRQVAEQVQAHGLKLGIAAKVPKSGRG